jgi:hypothetical protein
MRRWAALAAAYLVVLQAIFAGLASGANAASFSLDRSLAMTLCAGGDQPMSQSDGAATHELMSCCMLGCAFTGAGAPAAPTSISLPSSAGSTSHPASSPAAPQPIRAHRPPASDQGRPAHTVAPLAPC